MNALTRHIPMLATILDAYYESTELVETATLFGVTLDFNPYDGESPKQQWFKAARQIVENIDQSAHYALISALLDQLETKNSIAIANTRWEQRQANEDLAPKISEIQAALKNVASPSAITVPEASPFTAKSEVRAMLGSAVTPILVVDPYVGVGTLDCFLGVKQRIRLLTGDKPNSVEPQFEKALAEFQSESYTVDVRRSPMLHDRHFVFNNRCWLVGSSLKDAGKKAFNCLEVIDKASIVADLESKWSAGTPL